MTKAVFPVCFFLCCIEQLFSFSVLMKCIVYHSYWYLVSETSDDPCQWTKGRLLYRRWCWCWQRKTGNHLLWYVKIEPPSPAFNPILPCEVLKNLHDFTFRTSIKYNISHYMFGTFHLFSRLLVCFFLENYVDYHSC